MTVESRVALVTGANKGLGLEIARQLGKLGIIVVVGSRDLAKGEAAAAALKAEGVEAYPLKLDVTNQADIDNVPGYFTSKFGKLDILINNAGVNHDFEGEINSDTFRRTYEANVIAPYALTTALLPLLKSGPAGRIVNHSSIIGSIESVKTQDFGAFANGPYTSSKAALNMLTVIFAHQLKGTKVKVNSAHPGWVKTDMGGKEAPMELEDGAKTAVRLATLPDDGPTAGFFHMEKSLPW